MSEKNLIIFLIMLLLVSRNNDAIRKDVKAIHYDEETLRSFIISPPGISEKTALACLDSILNATSGDSVKGHRPPGELSLKFNLAKGYKRFQ